MGIAVRPVADAPPFVSASNSFAGNAGSAITLTGLTSLADTDGSEQLSLKLSGFPAGTTFSVGVAGTGADAGKWVITSADIASLGSNPLTMTTPSSFGGSFSLHVDATVTDKATLQGGPVTDTRTFSNDIAVAVDKLTATSDSLEPSGSGWVFDAADGHYYRYVSASVSYATAQSNAANDGAYLATITDANEDGFITSLIHGTAWTAGVTHNANPNGSDPGNTGHSPDTTSVWSWTAGPESGNQFTYTNWHQGEPNGGFGATDAAMQVYTDGTWNDVPATPSWTAGYVEEWGGIGNQISFKQNTAATINTSVLLANDTDSLGKAITVTAVGDANHQSVHGGTVTLNGNAINYTPASNFSGQDSFTYTISDGGQTKTATVTFNVEATSPTFVVSSAADDSSV